SFTLDCYADKVPRWGSGAATHLGGAPGDGLRYLLPHAPRLAILRDPAPERLVLPARPAPPRPPRHGGASPLSRSPRRDNGRGLGRHVEDTRRCLSVLV